MAAHLCDCTLAQHGPGASSFPRNPQNYIFELSNERNSRNSFYVLSLSGSRVTLCDVMNFQEYSQVPQWGAAASQGYFYIFLFLHFPSLLLAALSMRK